MADRTDRNVFVIITAETCGACAKFKEKGGVREKILRKLNELNIVRIEEIVLRATTTSTPDARELLERYHPNLRVWIGWFPQFLLFTSESWDNKYDPLKGSIFNGTFDPLKYDQTTREARLATGPKPVQDSRYKINADNIVSWIYSTSQMNNHNSSHFSSYPDGPEYYSDHHSQLSNYGNEPVRTRAIPTVGSGIKYRPIISESGGNWNMEYSKWIVE